MKTKERKSILLFGDAPYTGTRSPAVARMANRTAPVVKLTLTLTLTVTGHNLAKQALPLKRAHYEAK